MIAQPLLFTVEFRRKMAELPQRARLEWLASLARQLQGPEPWPESLAAQLREVARACRLPLVASVQSQLGPFEPALLAALLEVPRERFVRAEDLERSADDTPLPLDGQGLATISAPHAYLLSFRLLELARGQSLVELGSGSGYGAALASFIVGPTGSVTTFEIDRALAAWAARNLAGDPVVKALHADAVASAPRWGQASRIVVTFAVGELPPAWTQALPEGGRLVAPVGPPGQDQRLVLVRRQDGQLVTTEHGAVRYVANRSMR